MIYRKKKMTIPQYRARKEIFDLFGYKEEKYVEKGQYAYVTFSLDENSKNYFELRMLEKKVFKKGPPFFPIFIFVGTAFVLLSIFAVYLAISVRYKTPFDLGDYSLGFLVPAGSCLLGCVIYTIFYFKINQKIVEKGVPSEEELAKMVHEITKK